MMILSCLSSTGWFGEDQHGEAHLLCPLSPRKAGSHWCLPLREAHPRRGSPSLWVSRIGRETVAFQEFHYIFWVRQWNNISRKSYEVSYWTDWDWVAGFAYSF